MIKIQKRKQKNRLTLKQGANMKVHHSQLKKYTNNLEQLFAMASDSHKEEGRGWYLNAHNICKELSIKYNVSFIHTCQVMAILSPAASWEQNVKSCENMLKAYASQESIDSFKVTTYNQNKKKAWEVLHGREGFILTSSNMKTYSFFWNIWNVSDDSRVTIDRHAIKAMKGIDKAGTLDVNLTEYRKAQHIYSQVAKRYGLKPHEFQAIIWLAYKHKVGR